MNWSIPGKTPPRVLPHTTCTTGLRRSRAGLGWLAVVALLASAAGPPRAHAQTFAANIVVPQTRAFLTTRPGIATARGVELTKVSAGVEIRDQVATTTLEIHLNNPTGSRQEAELLVPVPERAVVRTFTFQGAGGDVTAQLLPRDEARRIYNSIVAKLRDPALLEFAGFNLVRSSVFPVEPNATQRVRLTYEHLLQVDGDRVDYVLPRSESLEYTVPWTVTAKVRASHPISTIYSPSHRAETTRKTRDSFAVSASESAMRESGPFRLSYLMERNGLTASLFAYPGELLGTASGTGAAVSQVTPAAPIRRTKDGYFLLLAGLPAEAAKRGDGPGIKREVTIVLDRSGSMNGEKLDQVREAALQILAGLEPGEAFNLFVYNEAVDRFAAKPVLKSDETVKAAREYLRGVTARGGTNIYDALTEALQQRPTEAMLPIVLFLTDGLPTIGQTSEKAIREVATDRNPHERRVFTFGVGVDVNTPLLDKVASETRATATFVLPEEDVEVKVSQVFKKLYGPVLAEPELVVVDASGAPDPGRTRDVMPTKLPDLFEGDQLVLLGQYVGGEPLHFELRGNYLGAKRAFKFQFDLDKANKDNAFVPRLWASRKIGFLIDAIREMGGNGGPDPTGAPPSDPRMKELVDEIVRLSTEFGILTEYTSFLAREGTDLADISSNSALSGRVLQERAMNVRSGLGAVNQESNLKTFMRDGKLNYRNEFFDAGMNRVEYSGVQQISNRAFYRRGNQWVDGRAAGNQLNLDPSRIVEFGTDEFFVLVGRLVEKGRQAEVALRGDILLEVDGEVVLVKGP